MAAKYFSPADIIALNKQCNDKLLSLDFNNIRKSKNKKANVSYIPILCKNQNGKPTRVAIKINKQLIGASAKPSVNTEDEESNKNESDEKTPIKHINILFRKLTREDLEVTDYKEDSKETLLKNNAELIQCLDILANAYEHVVDDLIATRAKEFSIGKGARTVFSFRQQYRKATDEEKAEDSRRPENEQLITEEGIKLKDPLYRIRVPVDTTSGKVGYKTEKGFNHVVFDLNKCTEANGWKPVVAKLKKDGKFVDLTAETAKHFITNLSLVGGVFELDCVCVSKFGISVFCRFRDLHVLRHKPLERTTLTDEDFADMASERTRESEDVDIEEPTSKKTDDDDGDDDSDDDTKVEPNANLEETFIERGKKSKSTIIKTKSTQPKKSTKVETSKKSTKVHVDEPEVPEEPEEPEENEDNNEHEDQEVDLSTEQHDKTSHDSFNEPVTDTTEEPVESEEPEPVPTKKVAKSKISTTSLVPKKKLVK